MGRVRPAQRVMVEEVLGPYERYLLRAMPAAARAFSSNADAYDYLAESIIDWPSQEELRGWFLEAGLVHCQYQVPAHRTQLIKKTNNIFGSVIREKKNMNFLKLYLWLKT